MRNNFLLSLPYHPFILLLADVVRDFAIDLTCAKCHSQCLCHVLLDRGRYCRILIRGAHPDLCRCFVFELTRPQLYDLRTRNKGQNNICGKTLLEMGLDAKSMGGIDKNAGVLWCDNGFDDGREIVDIWKSLDTEQYVVERSFFIVRCILRSSDNYKNPSSVINRQWDWFRWETYHVVA